MDQKNLKKGHNIFFKNEAAGFEIKAINERFAVCVRALHIDHDQDILQFRVDMNAYNSLDEAYKAMRTYPIYTCVDFFEEIKAAHNLIFNPYDFEDDASCSELLEDLITGDTELTKRHRIDLLIDWSRTEKFNK